MTWSEFLKEEKKKEYYQNLKTFVEKEKENHNVFPPDNKVFAAFRLCPLENTKVVILGQDPYHEKGQAEGLAFSVPDGIKIPPSLCNIYNEIYSTQPDLKAIYDGRKAESKAVLPKSGELKKWAEQGVLLLNTVLTVNEGEANSHKGHGWETFTDNAIKLLNQQDRPIVFMLWGNNAISKKTLLNNPKHLVLTAPHPSPLSAYRGFFGCGHFDKCNEFLKENGVEPINWKI